MCAVACFTVLALADYRVGEDALSAAMRPPEPTLGDRAYALSRLVLDLAADEKNPTIHGAPAVLQDLALSPSDLLVPQYDSLAFMVLHAAVPLERRVRSAAGAITSTFNHAALAAGVPEAVVSQVADVFGWDLDFTKDLEPGARFRIAYEEHVQHGKSVSGQLLAAQLQSGGRWHDAYYYSDREGSEGAFFDNNGRVVGRRFLRYPVAYTRISSGFGARRFHPVLKVHRPHYGVDFAAPTGTPVRAMASGIVTKAGWYGGNGRLVKLRHDPIHQTAYAHLSRIATGLRPGMRVQKGETIGYVGQTGLATGPHLHFAMYLEGRYADPFKVELPRARSLHGQQLSDFRMGLTGLNRMLAAADPLPEDEPIVTAWLKD
jgi:murein DD-endopeptidase MepM/ murein hydrolase activator NlpD